MTLEQRHNSRLLWIIIGGISIVVLLFLAAQWFFAENRNESEKTQTPTTETQTKLPNSTQPSTKTADVSAASEPAPSTLVDDSILKTPVPEHPSLAKEEIAKLDDIQAQLKDQKSTLQAQHQDADTLIKLKEEQIKLLEAQLAEQK